MTTRLPTREGGRPTSESSTDPVAMQHIVDDTVSPGRELLLRGLNHVAVLTQDADGLHAFYRDVFGVTVWHDSTEGAVRLSFLTLGPHTQLNVFQIAGNDQASSPAPMFGRGRLDHLGLEAASQQAFDEIRRRLIACGASDGFVTDFGSARSVFFRDPDGLECEMCLHDPAATPADLNPPGTPAAGYPQAGAEEYAVTSATGSGPASS